MWCPSAQAEAVPEIEVRGPSQTPTVHQAAGKQEQDKGRSASWGKV